MKVERWLWFCVQLIEVELRVYAQVNWTIIGSDNGIHMFNTKPLSEPIIVYCQ